MLILGLVAVLVMVDPAFAADAAAEAGSGAGLKAIGAGLAIALAAALGAYSQGRIASTALESIGRNPGAAGQIQLPYILGLVFVETLVIFSFVIAMKLAGIF
jgi:F-type H+-transporting ATPase subunit c